jgi:cullin-4
MTLSGGSSGKATKPKPLVIKPLRPKTTSDHSNDPAFKQSYWSSLKLAIDAIQNETAVSTSLEQLYRSVEELCVQKHAEWLYLQLKEECEKHAVKVLKELSLVCGSYSSGTGEHVGGEMVAPTSDVLVTVGKIWDTYCSQLVLIRHIFLYLDRTYLIQKSEHRSIFDMGLYYFRQHLDTEFPVVKDMILQGILAVVDKERTGDAIQRDLLKNLVRMLALLGLYDGTFMPIFLDRTQSFFTQEAGRIILEVPLSEYLLYVERKIGEECNRCDATLEPITRAPLVQMVEACIIEPHIGYMLEHGFEKLIDEDRFEDLKRIYDVFGRVRGHKALCAAFKRHLKNVGSGIVSDPDKDAEMIKDITTLKKRVDRMIEQCFDDIAFKDAVKDAFGYFMNMRSNRPAELLAKHMDSILKGGGKARYSEDDLDAALDSSLALFRFISGKDAFEAFYKKDLAKRLLFNRSFSMDIEKSAISRLKAECGAHFTSKLEGMFTDSDLSKDIMSSFRASHEAMDELAKVCPGTDVSVQVLTSGLWPTYPLTECNFSSSLGDGLEVFKKHYLKKYSGRKLVWLYSLGTCVMKVQFASGSKELALSFFQAAVLMTFQEVDSMSFKDILIATGIEDSELRRTLQSLACGRERVLVKEPRGKDVNDDDVFVFNSEYTSKQYRVKINAIQMKETADDSKKTNEMVMQDRQHQIDAAIVRIMKTRKTLSHKLLMNELMTQLRFPVTATDLKKRVESLIEREYMERDDADMAIYNYVA